MCWLLYFYLYPVQCCGVSLWVTYRRIQQCRRRLPIRLTRQISRDSERCMPPTRGRRTGNRAVGKDGRQALGRRITQCKLLRWELPIEPETRTESSYKAQIKLRQYGFCGSSYLFQPENLKYQALLVWIVVKVLVKVWLLTLQKRTPQIEPSEECAPLGYYAASCSNSLSKFRDNISAPFSRGLLENGTDMSSRIVGKCPGLLTLENGRVVCPETWVRNYHYWLCNAPEERSSHLLLGRSWCSRKGAFCLRLRPQNLVACFLSVYCLNRIWKFGGLNMFL